MGSFERSPSTSGISLSMPKSNSHVEDVAVLEKTKVKDSESGLRWWSISTLGALDAFRADSISGFVLAKLEQSRQKSRSLEESLSRALSGQTPYSMTSSLWKSLRMKHKESGTLSGTTRTASLPRRSFRNPTSAKPLPSASPSGWVWTTIETRVAADESACNCLVFSIRGAKLRIILQILYCIS